MSPKRNLFVSFAESDGGHSYLAARAMLKPDKVAHLVFRTSVADSLDAVASGQAHFAVVPAYNTITQWEGATLKALATGAYEIYAQVCMPTSYVLVAHKDYMFEFVNAYLNLREPNLDPTAEEAAKIYTRFLTRIFVGAQADEQYRGRLVRPDLSHAPIELSRNPLRILEEMSRTELFKAMAAAAPNTRYGGFGGGYQQGPLPSNMSGGTVNIGATPVLTQQPINIGTPAGGPVPLMEMLQAPAALVAEGLLSAPGDPEGWDQPGSLGEIVGLLRKLLVLLNVYSFGAPDLPENKTQYLLIGRRGHPAPVDAIDAPQAAPTRIMTLVRPGLRKASADQWLRPRNLLSRRARDHGFVFDRPPLMISPGNTSVFLFEGGKPKDGLLPNPLSWLESLGTWLAETFVPAEARDKSGVKTADKTLRKALEKKQERKFADGSPEKFDVTFLGQYQTWCPEPGAGNTCWCCEEAHAEKESDTGMGVGLGPLLQFLIAGLIALTMLGLIVVPVYCAMTGACNWFGEAPKFEVRPPPAQTETQLPPAATAPTTPPPAATRPSYPGVDTTAPPSKPEHTNNTVVPPPRVEKPRPVPIFHVAFFEAKANLTPDAMNALASAASQVLQMNRPATLRVIALGPRENDDELWRRRIFAVKDELVRLGVPAGRIRYDGSGPYVVTIRADQPPRSNGATRPRLNEDLDSIPDPLGDGY